MTNQTQVSVQSEVYTFRPRDYDVFAGLDVDKHSIAVTFCNHEGLLRSLRLPYSAAQLLSYVRKHYAEQRLAFAYEAGPSGFGPYCGAQSDSGSRAQVNDTHLRRLERATPVCFTRSFSNSFSQKRIFQRTALIEDSFSHCEDPGLSGSP